MLLAEYDIEYKTQKAIKGSGLSEHLAHQPIEEYQSVKFDFPDEEVMYLRTMKNPYPKKDRNQGPIGVWYLMGITMPTIGA